MISLPAHDKTAMAGFAFGCRRDVATSPPVGVMVPLAKVGLVWIGVVYGSCPIVVTPLRFLLNPYVFAMDLSAKYPQASSRCHRLTSRVSRRISGIGMCEGLQRRCLGSHFARARVMAHRHFLCRYVVPHLDSRISFSSSSSRIHFFGALSKISVRLLSFCSF